MVEDVRLVGATEPLDGVVTVAWAARDDDRDTLRFDLLYSPGGDEPYRAVHLGIENTTVEVDTTRLSGGNGTGASAAQTLQLSGRAGQRPSHAAAVCTTTDAIVVAAATGEGMLIRLGVRPMTIDVLTDRTAIARFLVHRGYTAD